MDYGGTGSFNNSHYSDHIHFYETNICIAGWNIVVAMTNKQLEQSFMIEGLFNTGISLFMTIIIGIPGGYMIGTFLEKAGMSTGFVFPTRAFLLFVTVMLLLEVLMTILLIHSWKKQSVIEIMRN